MLMNVYANSGSGGGAGAPSQSELPPRLRRDANRRPDRTNAGMTRNANRTVGARRPRRDS